MGETRGRERREDVMKRLSEVIDTRAFQPPQRAEMKEGEVKEVELTYMWEMEGRWGRYWYLQFRNPEDGRYYSISTASKPVARVLIQLREALGKQGYIEPPIRAHIRRTRYGWVLH
jgi:hypothetical protein